MVVGGRGPGNRLLGRDLARFNGARFGGFGPKDVHLGFIVFNNQGALGFSYVFLFSKALQVFFNVFLFIPLICCLKTKAGVVLFLNLSISLVLLLLRSCVLYGFVSPVVVVFRWCRDFRVSDFSKGCLLHMSICVYALDLVYLGQAPGFGLEVLLGKRQLSQAQATASCFEGIAALQRCSFAAVMFAPSD